MMKKAYPVFFTKTSDIVLIDVPDFEILTESYDTADAISMARDAIELSCVSKEDRGEPIPSPSKINELNVCDSIFFGEGDTIALYVDVDPDAYRRKLNERKKDDRNNVETEDPSQLTYSDEILSFDEALDNLKRS